MRWQQWLALGLLSVVALAGCATTGEQIASKERSLYGRLGGKPVITAVVDDFVVRVAGDPRINRFFTNPDTALLKVKLIDQICEASGGPCKYTGKDMQTAHQGMGITHADFDALIDDFITTLDKFKFWIPDKEKHELLAAWGTLRKDIVTK